MRALLSLLMVVAVGCVGPADNPTTVKDLRVLGVSFEPPELMAAQCPDFTSGQVDPAAFFSLVQPVELTALVQDPAGGGRKLQYEVWACARPGDRTCSEEGRRFRIYPPGDFFAEADPGELRLTLNPGAAGLDPQNPESALLLKVFEEDPYKGLGGLRMPIVLHVRAGEEEVYASKLMLFSCRFFEGMEPNANPQLPGLRLQGEPWPQGSAPELTGEGPFEIVPEELSDREEPYVVVNFSLQPQALTEAWEISWYTDYGRMSVHETGGFDFAGQPGRHRVEWLPPPANPVERDVTVWAVVRDGRGGLSWLTRRLHYRP